MKCNLGCQLAPGHDVRACDNDFISLGDCDGSCDNSDDDWVQNISPVSSPRIPYHSLELQDPFALTGHNVINIQHYRGRQ